jgi:hypothetical protein
MNCEHHKRIGDNYGVSCQGCKGVLEGYGYGGWFGSNLKGNERCIHVWWKINDIEEECMYCHAIRKKEKKANYSKFTG